MSKKTLKKIIAIVAAGTMVLLTALPAFASEGEQSSESKKNLHEVTFKIEAPDRELSEITGQVAVIYENGDSDVCCVIYADDEHASKIRIFEGDYDLLEVQPQFNSPYTIIAPKTISVTKDTEVMLYLMDVDEVIGNPEGVSLDTYAVKADGLPDRIASVNAGATAESLATQEQQTQDSDGAIMIAIYACAGLMCIIFALAVLLLIKRSRS